MWLLYSQETDLTRIRVGIEYCKVSFPFLVTKQSNQICPCLKELSVLCAGKKVRSIKKFVFWLISI